ncbi:hypothetical protein DXH78_01665 [Undibacter mobilis]|uniref:Uncharacterized protein n=1 Tax=Undibacter mobilis TaxID=2292256 RepID=A0A371B7R9_9BRAD|nr:hypothetical protein DXH78_01665 [Undibacter mobilis]
MRGAPANGLDDEDDLDGSITREIYAGFSSSFLLREAAAAPEFADQASTNLETAIQRADNHLELDGERDRDRTRDPFHVSEAAAEAVVSSNCGPGCESD